MKSTGIVRKMDKLGRIVLPVELRKSLKIDLNTPLEMFVDGDYILLKNTTLPEPAIFAVRSATMWRFSARRISVPPAAERSANCKPVRMKKAGRSLEVQELLPAFDFAFSGRRSGRRSAFRWF